MTAVEAVPNTWKLSAAENLGWGKREVAFTAKEDEATARIETFAVNVLPLGEKSYLWNVENSIQVWHEDLVW